jgi:hypothetical protein
MVHPIEQARHVLFAFTLARYTVYLILAEITPSA